MPTLLISQGIGVTKSLQYTFAIALAAPIGPLIGYFFADRFERNGRSRAPRSASPDSAFCSRSRRRPRASSLSASY